MTKSKSSASSIVGPPYCDAFSILCTILNATCVAGAALTVISPFNKV